MDATEQLSLYIGLPKATPDAVQILRSELTVTAEGGVMVGF